MWSFQVFVSFVTFCEIQLVAALRGVIRVIRTTIHPSLVFLRRFSTSSSVIAPVAAWKPLDKLGALSSSKRPLPHSLCLRTTICESVVGLRKIPGYTPHPTLSHKGRGDAPTRPIAGISSPLVGEDKGEGESVVAATPRWGKNSLPVLWLRLCRARFFVSFVGNPSYRRSTRCR